MSFFTHHPLLIPKFSAAVLVFQSHKLLIQHCAIFPSSILWSLIPTASAIFPPIFTHDLDASPYCDFIQFVRKIDSISFPLPLAYLHSILFSDTLTQMLSDVYKFIEISLQGTTEKQVAGNKGTLLGTRLSLQSIVFYTLCRRCCKNSNIELISSADRTYMKVLVPLQTSGQNVPNLQSHSRKSRRISFSKLKWTGSHFRAFPY